MYQDHWYASIFNYILTQKAKKILTSGPLDLKKLGALMDSHQKILHLQLCQSVLTNNEKVPES